MFEHQVREEMHLKKFNLFQTSAGQKNFSNTKGSTDEQVQ